MLHVSPIRAQRVHCLIFSSTQPFQLKWIIVVIFAVRILNTLTKDLSMY